MPAVSTLKSSRARDKRALIKEEAEAQKILQEKPTNNLEDVIRLHLATGKILLNLEVKFSRVELANEKVIEACESNNDLTNAEQFQKVLDEDAELMDSVLSRTSELKVMKEELERVRKTLETQSSNSSTAHTAPLSTLGVNLSNIWSQSTPGPIKPPQIDIRPFDGDVMKWRKFWDQFEASVDKTSYSPVDKFNYLKSKLRGDALSAISGYELSNSNYSVVVDVLKQRFGNPQLIVDAHYRSLSHLPMATNQTASLRQCYDSMERHLRSLEAVGENVNHRYFVAIISEKLPQKVLYQLYMLKGDNEEWTVPKLRQLLGKHITALEMAGGECHVPQSPVRLSGDKHFQTEGGRLPNLRPTAGGLLAGNSRHQAKRFQPSQIKCVYCGQSHWSDECKKFATLQARKEKLRGSCYKCLQKGHMLKDCQRDRSCAHCGKPGHHRSLCVKLFPDASQGLNTNPQNTMSQNTDITSEPQNISQDVEEMMLSSGSQVQMQTATSVVTNSLGSLLVSVCTMLDSGSQRTYVTENLARYLNLQLKAPEKLAVVTFGTEKPKYLRYRPSELQLNLKDGKQMTLNVSVVPSITGRITRAPLDRDDVTFIKSEGLDSKLADTLPTESECYPVEMLIGNDYYFDLLLPRKIELRPGLYLFQSRLGWIISGRCQTESDDASRQPALIVSTMGIPPRGVKQTTHMLSSVDAPLFMRPNLEQFWDLESLGIKESPTTLDDDQAVSQFNKTVVFSDGRYLVTWPWKKNHLIYPRITIWQ